MASDAEAWAEAIELFGGTPPNGGTTGELVLRLAKAIKSGAGGNWGQDSTAKYSGSGSPIGVVTPSGEGDLYVDNTTPALWQATGTGNTDWQQVGTSGQINPDSSNSSVSPEAASQTFPCDGAPHYLVWDGSDPGVDWMDNTGNIILPGLYETFVYVSKGAAATTPGLFFGVLGFFFNDAPPIALDPLTQFNQQLSVCAEVISLLEEDLPFALYTPNRYPRFMMPTDATGTVQGWSLIERLQAYGPL